ncbi:hypothetical protein KY331_01295 [Candidatus Woesearchaeota archaeon]|nr:hypothetical protein [Candidatus Woesearchaeota archaeon]
MEILINYALVTLITFLGLFVGFILALIAKEELKPGKHYFILLQNLIFSLIIFFLLFYNDLMIWLSALIAFLTFIFLRKSKVKPIATYLSLAVIFNAAFRNRLSVFILIASLIFIYGIPIGSLLTYNLKNKKSKVIKDILIKYGIFIPIALVLFFL